jgi:histidyl-tRNA synthetase
MGDVVLTELLEDRGLLPSTDREADLYLVTIVPELRPLALELARVHRKEGRRVIYALRAQSVKKQFSAAAVEGARWVVILGPGEVERGVAVVRDMATGSEGEVPLEVLKRGEGLGGEEE